MRLIVYLRRLLSQPSQVLSVTLPRPMGVTFEEDSRSQRLVVCDLVEGSIAHQRAQVKFADSASSAFFCASKTEEVYISHCINFFIVSRH